MNKTSAYITALIITLSSCRPDSVSSAAVKADLPDEVVYQLTNRENNPSGMRPDQNEDGIITEEELAGATHIKIDLSEIDDISFFSRMPSVKYLDLLNGEITDFSVLKELKNLKQVRFFNVPMTDLSSLEGIQTEELWLSGMDQITAEQRVDFLKPDGITIKKWSSAYILDRYSGILNGYDLSYTIDDEDVCCITHIGSFGTKEHKRDVYGKKAGETAYHLYVNGTELASGKITVEERDVYDPPVHEGASPTVKKYNSLYYDKSRVLLNNGTLYSYKGDEIRICEENVKEYTNFYRITDKREYHYFDVVLKNDGTLIVNGKEVENQKFSELRRGAVSTEDGKLYLIYGEKGKSRGCTLIPVCDDLREMCEDAECYYVSKEGKLISIDTTYDEDDLPHSALTDTEIMNPSQNLLIAASWPGDSVYIDENNAVWRLTLKYSKLTKTLVADEAESIGKAYYEKESREIPYFRTSDGKYYSVYTDHAEFTPSEPAADLRYGYAARGSDGIYIYAQDLPDEECYLNWFLLEDNTLALSFMYQDNAITNVKQTLGFDFSDDNTPYYYFMRTDGSIWNYCYKTNSFKEKLSFDNENAEEPVLPEKVKGDSDGNGIVNAADLMNLLKFLFGEAEISDSCDINGDGKISISDLVLLKNIILE